MFSKWLSSQWNRTHFRVCILGGTSFSISPCFASFRLIWTIIGHVRRPQPKWVRFYLIPVLDSLTRLVNCQEIVELNDKQRVTLPHGNEFYSFMNYVAYVLYPPLYIAGPIITFNDFIWQVKTFCFGL